MLKRYFRLNRQITAPKLRVLDESGKQIGIISTEEALRRAFDEELDLVEIAPEAQPPVAKILDFEKFKYEKERQEKEAKRKLREVEVKEIRVGPFVSKHDLDTRLTRIREFLKKGHKVKITIKFTGRQMRHPEFGNQLLDQIIKDVEDEAKTEQERRFIGRQLSILVGPKTKK